MEKDEDDKVNHSNDNVNHSPAYSPTRFDSRARLDQSSHASTSKSPEYVPSDSERRDKEKQKRSMSLDSYDSRDSRDKVRSSRSFDRSNSSSRERNLNSIEIKGLTKMVFATHLEQIFAAYGQIEEIFMPSDHYSMCENIVKRTILRSNNLPNILAHPFFFLSVFLYESAEENLGRAFITYRSSLSAEKAEECMDKGQIDGAIISVRCEDIQMHELKTSYDSGSRMEHKRNRRNSIRDEHDHRSSFRNKSERYPTNSYERERRKRSQSRIRSRSSSPYQ